MSSNETLVVMRTWRWLGPIAAALGAACAGEPNFEPVMPDDFIPQQVEVSPVSVSSIRIAWPAVENAVRFHVDRRRGLEGPFEMIGTISAATTNAMLDTDLEADTFYGYRVRSEDQLGSLSAPSVVKGARTPPLPGIDISTSLSVNQLAFADPDGYFITIVGPESTAVEMGVNAKRRVNPLAPGSYTLTLLDLLPTCSVREGDTRIADVVGTGVETIAPAEFVVDCKDPSTGTITVNAMTTGEDRPPSHALTLDGILADATLPDNERIVQLTGNIPSSSGSLTWQNLKPGDYDVELVDLPENCELTGTAVRSVVIEPLAEVVLDYSISCRPEDEPPPDPTKPFFWENTWVPASAPNGETVELDITLDMSADDTVQLGSWSGLVRYNPDVLEFQSAVSLHPDFVVTTTNPLPDHFAISGINLNFNAGPTGTIPVARVRFAVVGEAGQTTRTRTENIVAGNLFADDLRQLFQPLEATFTVGEGGGGGGAGGVVADANGPYSGTVGQAITFSSTGSSSEEGTITSYAWDFGDGGTGTGASPQHSYTQAGSYTVELTVTDDQSNTDVDEAAVTVTAPVGQPPVANANGPYGATVGQPIAFSAAGSADPDPGGSIVGYAWTFGDGTNGTGASVTKAYTAAGSYTATLTVTDNDGQTDTDEAAVTITSASTPFTWRSAFGGAQNDLVQLTVSYDLTGDIPETAVNPEELDRWVVDELEWDPTVLEYFAFVWNNGAAGTVNFNNAANGSLAFSAQQPSTNRTGFLNLVTIFFRVIGTPGAQTATQTSLGPLSGTAATGNFDYRNKTNVLEGSFTVP